MKFHIVPDCIGTLFHQNVGRVSRVFFQLFGVPIIKQVAVHRCSAGWRLLTPFPRLVCLEIIPFPNFTNGENIETRKCHCSLSFKNKTKTRVSKNSSWQTGLNKHSVHDIYMCHKIISWNHSICTSGDHSVRISYCSIQRCSCWKDLPKSKKRTFDQSKMDAPRKDNQERKKSKRQV